MVCEEVLRIRNFPKVLTDHEKEDFLRHFCATEIRIITSKVKQNSIAYARFESKQMARSVLKRIHQIKVLDSYLSAEFAKHDLVDSSIKLKRANESDEKKYKKNYKNFITKINAFNSSCAFNQPPPSHLRYNYPKVNRATIKNIAQALESIPKFYTQVLHLMNKMNLPPPFSNEPDEMEIEKEASESEIESDPDDKKTSENVLVAKRKMPQKKVIKRPRFIKPIVTAPTSDATIKVIPEEVFEKVELQQSKKIEVIVPPDCIENKQDQEDAALNVIETIEPVLEQIPDKELFISDEDLAFNRIPAKDLQVLSVFKDYKPGIPSNRLYIKNIAKSVEKCDLEFIYKRYENSGGDSLFDIRLMKEGRMKGQSFVTLDSTEIAQKALEETNGYILKDKPLVVVFGKTQSVTKATNA